MNKKLLVAALLVATILTAGCVPNYSNGAKVGVVTKLSNKGLIFKSWEGELNAGGMVAGSDNNGNTTFSPNVLTFNVDPSQVAAVQDALDTGKRVELVYHQWLIKPFTIDNSRVVVEVRAK